MHMHGKHNVTVHTPRVPSTSLAPSLLRSRSTLSHPTSLTDQSQQSTGSYFQLYTVICPSLRVVINIVCSSQCTHLATELLAEQDVPCCQVPVDEPSPWEVPHTLSNLLAEGQQLLWQTFINNGPRAKWQSVVTVIHRGIKPLYMQSRHTCIYSAHTYIHTYQ